LTPPTAHHLMSGIFPAPLGPSACGAIRLK
jgi:hypothetical protein